ncbi:MAG TPA: accessory factor UbiK family protein [Acidocella sp.]|jgi:BMFP domain-containing protein YqiC|nr:MAG: pyrroline-5-carboxylate reductase [Acidocella sp. 20-58-15]HQT39682.1 accessory factor UbiK family protein [Acidocella sp.]
MSDRPKFFDDLAGVAGGALSALAGMREEMASMVRARVDETVRRLDLIKRDEFDVMVELATRAREQAEQLEARVKVLEAALKDTQPTLPIIEQPESHEPEI